MRPHIICHMATTLDGRIDAEAVEAVLASTHDYEATGEMLEGDAWLCGRTTMQQHLAEPEPFVSTTGESAGPQPVHVARRAQSYAVSVDTRGTLRWAGANIEGGHLICIVSERAPADYLAMLRDQGISYIVAGARQVNLAKAMALLGEHFGIRRLLLEGGGHINGGFVDANLIDEVSLLLVPGIDGRHGIPAVFDGLARRAAVPLKLKSIEQRANDVLWIRYEVVRG
jgi:2,5-diamino-6-(ribosylamino)-4(3H)-pyrimidinone 5'-phosphate reductase